MLAPFSDQSGLACQDPAWGAAAAAAHAEADAAWLVPPEEFEGISSPSESGSDSDGPDAGGDPLVAAIQEQFRLAGAAEIFEPAGEPEPAGAGAEIFEPAVEPEGSDAADDDALPSKSEKTFEGQELVPGTWLDFPVGTAEPAAEPLEQVGGGANGPLMAPLQFRTNSAEARFHRYVGFR